MNKFKYLLMVSFLSMGSLNADDGSMFNDITSLDNLHMSAPVMFGCMAGYSISSENDESNYKPMHAVMLSGTCMILFVSSAAGKNLVFKDIAASLVCYVMRAELGSLIVSFVKAY